MRAGDRLTPTLETATDADLPDVVALMNRAYRAAGPDAGWTTESGYITGQRTCLTLLREEMATAPAGALLLWRTPPALTGCVRLEPSGNGIWHLGALTIDPRLQNAGHGRALLAAAEDVVRARRGRTIEMSVVGIRHELLAWYLRRGYRATGATAPFPYDDLRFGTPLRDDLSFTILSKAFE